MKARIVSLFFFTATLPSISSAKDYVWSVAWNPPDFGLFSSPDGACSAFYSYIKTTYGGAGMAVTPYIPPYPRADPRPGADPAGATSFSCDFAIAKPGDPFNPMGHIYILRDGDGCTEGVPFNPSTGKCERPDEDQERKEIGNAASHAVAGVVICGNPINLGAGNKYQEETDFVDGDGELRLTRYYNGLEGVWRHSYQTSLLIRNEALVLRFDDGYSALFTRKDGSLIPDADEAGQIASVGDGWAYTSATNETYVFDPNGQLKRLRQSDGKVQSVTRSNGPNGEINTTVTDSMGHTLVIVTDSSDRILRATSSSLEMTYGYDLSKRLTSITKRWPARESIRRFVYEDTSHPGLITGLIDERGIRYAAWTYDTEGRAISSEHAGGVGRTAMTYAPDGSVKVTNALGHATTFRYEVVQGMKRVVAVEGEPSIGCPASNSTYKYKASGRVESHTDAIGSVTAYEYDELGREVRRVEASGTKDSRETLTTWDGTSRRPSTIKTPLRMTTYTYDDEGRSINVTVSENKE